MKPYYRQLMRGSTCVGVAVVFDADVTLVTELSGRPEAIESFMNDIPQHSENPDDWFYALNDLLPMTYKIGEITLFEGDDPRGADANESAHVLAADIVVVDSRSSRLSTTRVVAHATIDRPGFAEMATATTGGLLKGRDDEEPQTAPAEEAESQLVADTVHDIDAGSDEGAEAERDSDVAHEPVAPPRPSLDMVVVDHQLNREPLSIADDGAGLHEQWFILLEDWNGLAAIFAGDRENYVVLSRSTTQLMSEQIAESVPTQAANLEHWITMLIRELPAGVWLRSFTSARSVTEETLEAPIDVLRAAIAFYGTPSPAREFEIYGSGPIDGSLTLDADSGELIAAQKAAENQESPAESVDEDGAEATEDVNETAEANS